MPLPTLLADRDDPQAVESALAGRRFDVVVDCSGRNARQVLTTAHVLDGRFERYLFVSTPAVYDDDAPRPLSERAFAEGALSWGEYGIRKAQAEAALRRRCGARLTIVRPGYVYGPFNNFARETFLWSRMLRNRAVFVPGDGSTRASFVYAPDLAQAVLALAADARAAGRTLNVAHRQQLTFDQFVLEAAQAAGLRARIVHVPPGTLGLGPRDYFPFRDISLALDVTALERLQPVPDTPFARGLSATYASYSPAALATVARESSVDLELSLLLRTI